MTESQTIASLVKRLARRERELQAVHRITEALHSESEIDRLARRTLETAIETLQGSAGSILLHDAGQQALVFRYVEGPSAQVAKQLLGRTVPDTEGIAGHVFQTGEGVLSADVSQDPRHSRRIDLATHYRTRNMVTAPLITTQPRCIGVMQVLNRRRGAFDEADLKTLEILCVQAAVGIEAARLHAALLAIEREKRRFACEVLRCITADKLRLVEASEIPAKGDVVARLDFSEPEAYAALREAIEAAAVRGGMHPDLVDDLVLAASEASANTMKHGINGKAEVRSTEDAIQVHIWDEGPGIRPKDLPKVLFQAGFSTKLSLGMGYTLMLELADRVWLATSEHGTHVLLEKSLKMPPPPEPMEEVLDRMHVETVGEAPPERDAAPRP